jgi:hypothetical protein
MRPGAEERDDVALLHSVARGDEEALAALYDRHAARLTVRLTRRCAMPDVVDHAVQDTFLALWREAGTYRGGGDVAAFIWGIGVRRLMPAALLLPSLTLCVFALAAATVLEPRAAAVTAGALWALPALLLAAAHVPLAIVQPNAQFACAAALCAAALVLLARHDRFELGWLR